MMNDLKEHYDKLVKEGNDPVYDPQPLRDYMSKWDGDAFFDKLELTAEKEVLEIGVGTGRLAVHTVPRCKTFTGIDVSPKTVERAKENLSGNNNVNIICDDFLTYDFERKYDIIYSSLCFMHIESKQKAVSKATSLLKQGGRLVISIDKNRSEYIDMGSRKIKIYPDTPEEISDRMKKAGLRNIETTETEFAYIISSDK